ncbi:hypothetical protein Caci_6453 [Catenulispora acidiphila DSM 44928]|uniref:Uncharacterized protein n=1 Tax=Catenulispora acidiphila (strain DSM 44928 / JCM 14897 / NBRC 102108 / NRRL B-24433 / ID139908) TaxID=479433 RepID=C7PWM4_CATAD|nr:hypothetical protein [Catenulispora acidiphila]ACU75304.1 hypothetical protein Caci_6453 [Catenulispora acidiphila DSM 44928]
MPRIGFEWQFNATDLTFQERNGGPWGLITDIPSKGLIFHWANPGVKIESDSGEVEIITDPVTTWGAMVGQLVLIGEVLLALGMAPPDFGSLPMGRIRTSMEQSSFGTGLGIGSNVTGGGMVRPKRKAANVIKYPQQVNLDAGGHIQLRDIVGVPTVAINESDDKKLLAFLLAADIHDPVDVVNDVEVPATNFRNAGDRIAVFGMHDGAYNGVPQCTMERPLSDLTAMIRPFSPQAEQNAAQWLHGQGASPELTGFVTMLYYYRAMFAQPTIRTIDDGPKAGFGLLPRMNVRSVYQVLLDNADRGIFDALVGALAPAARNVPMCPHGYKAGDTAIVNTLTWGQWLDSIRLGDAGAGIPSLDDDFAGIGPRGANYDRLSPPLGYPAHTHPARATAWFTYAMGRVNADPNNPVVLVEYRDVSGFGIGANTASANFTNFVKVAGNAAIAAGL